MRYELWVFQEDIPILRSEFLKNHLQELKMLQLFKKLFCKRTRERGRNLLKTAFRMKRNKSREK